MGIGVKRPKIDTSKIDSLLRNEPIPSQDASNIESLPEQGTASVVDSNERGGEVVPPTPEPITDETQTFTSTETQQGVMDVSEISFEKKSKTSYSCEQKLRVVLPSLDSIIENKSDEFSMSRTSNITLPDTLIRELQELTLVSRKKAYTRNILSNIVTTFLAAYKKDIESAKQRKNNSQN